MEKQQYNKTLKLEKTVLKLKEASEKNERKLCLLKDQCLATMEYQCHLLTCLNDLRCQQIAELQERLNFFTMNLGQITQQLIFVNNRLEHDGDFDNRALPHQRQHKHGILDRLALELRCGICSEIMVFATTLNCMHTFCQYCVAQWKNESPAAGCPVCREPTTFERRNFLVDNMIAIMVSLYSEDEKISRKELVKQQEELHRNLLAAGLRTPESNNPFYRITDRGLVLGEMQIGELATNNEASESFQPSPMITRNFIQNTTQTRGRHDNRRRNHYARLLVNIGRRRISRNSQHPIPPCSSDNVQTPNVSIVSSTSELSSRIGETALALTLLYIGVILFLYYTLHNLLFL
ncbi:Uncharacterized protein APZ42_005834 [Daphnia magna]|uniref:RING-type domain-containing protein n=1 Tax=Daphnia magna TaxID=35525 RepID=A0A164G8D1_9CRUS|nr:Uncharacterized protein APZ42_005834 [Daphnia magna]